MDLLSALHAKAGGKVKISSDLDALFKTSTPVWSLPETAPLPSSRRKRHQRGSDDDERREGKEEEDAEGTTVTAVAHEARIEGESEKDGKHARKRHKKLKERRATDEEKLPRTIFVGNVPMDATSKTLKKEFRQYGAIESIRFRSIARGDTKLPRYVAAISGTHDEQRQAKNAFIVFETAEAARAALHHNGHVLDSHHLRVDAAGPPGQSRKYDPKRSVFVGQLPFDAEDDAVMEFFRACGPVEAVRLVRDRVTNRGKGIGYVLFETADAARKALTLHGAEFAGRTLSVSRVLTDAATAGDGKKAAAAAAAAAGGPQGPPSRAPGDRDGAPFEGRHAAPGVRTVPMKRKARRGAGAGATTAAAPARTAAKGKGSKHRALKERQKEKQRHKVAPGEKRKRKLQRAPARP